MRSAAIDELELLTFDCYGTLIDWLGGISAAVRTIPSLYGCDFEQLVRDRDALDKELVFGRFEPYGKPYVPYGELLAASLHAAAARQGREITEREMETFVASMATWPPFAESSTCLRRLASRYRLAILSNVETRVLESSIALLDAPFEFFVTAQEIRSYKPWTQHFTDALIRGHVRKERVLHVACSLFHDVRPALLLGWHVAFANRENEPVPSDARPDLVVPNLAALCEALRV
jgi:2-haloalkanoic acid dehalogenase type II